MLRKLGLSLIACGCLVSGAFANLSDGLVAHYEFEKSLKDTKSKDIGEEKVSNGSYVNGVFGKGFKLAGVVGAILSIPVATAVSVFIKDVFELKAKEESKNN